MKEILKLYEGANQFDTIESDSITEGAINHVLSEQHKHREGVYWAEHIKGGITQRYHMTNGIFIKGITFGVS